MDKPRNIADAKRALTESFRKAECDGADYAARAILQSVTGLSKADQIARGNDLVTPDHYYQLRDYAERYIGGEPLDNIIGSKPFWKDSFLVNRDVLSPRPETEGIIELAVKLFDTTPPRRILDLGTGSGAILLSLLREFPDSFGLGVDLSEAALAVVKHNADALELSAEFIHDSWFRPVEESEPFDLIVSNPPYIDDAAMGELPSEVRDYDPDMALRGGADGLEAYREIITGAPQHLTTGGWLIVEIGYDQGKSVPALFDAAGFSDVSVRKDFAGHDRIVSGRKA